MFYLLHSFSKRESVRVILALLLTGANGSSIAMLPHAVFHLQASLDKARLFYSFLNQPSKGGLCLMSNILQRALCECVYRTKRKIRERKLCILP